MHITAILLAAGASTRFGGDKLAAPYRGQTIFQCALQNLTDSSLINDIIVIVNPAFKQQVHDERISLLTNADHREGMGSSLRLGVMQSSSQTDAFIIVLADMPTVKTATIDSIIEAYETRGQKIMVPVYKGKRGHPVMMSSIYRDELLQITGDIGAREVINKHPQMIGSIETADSGVVFDVDLQSDCLLPEG
ncbi:MAG: nucleotidyltransferase family protein [Deltaproteobacteria bacterium]|nr:nucleotidyltransferase family protein [Deltaproteobacteria bacterium]